MFFKKESYYFYYMPFFISDLTVFISSSYVSTMETASIKGNTMPASGFSKSDLIQWVTQQTPSLESKSCHIVTKTK